MERWEKFALLATLLVGFALRLYAPDLSYYNMHVERDIYRATQLVTLDKIPLLGSEMQYGGRVFGPFVYFLYAVPLFFSRSTVGVSLFVAMFNCVVLYLVWRFTRSWFGAVVALIATVLYAVFPLEIVNLRYIWNPCFLPGMVVGVFAFLYLFLNSRNDWHFIGVVFFLTLAFQLHFSALMLLPVIVIGMVASRRFPNIKVIAACIILLGILFLPMVWYEFRSTSSNLHQVIDAPEAVKQQSARFRFNPNAVRNFIHVITLDWHEDAYRIGFIYLYFPRLLLQNSIGKYFKIADVMTTLAGLLQLALWATGVIVSALQVRRGWKSRTAECSSRLMLLLWQFSPLPFLSFFSFHIQMNSGPSLIPIRYYLISFPAQFILSGIGFDYFFCRGKISSIVGKAGLTFILVVYTSLCCAYLGLLNETKTAAPYMHWRVPTMRSLINVREALLNDFKITANDFYTRVTAQNILQPYAGESTMDYLVTQDQRAYNNPGLPAGTSLIIYQPPYYLTTEFGPVPDEIKSIRIPGDLPILRKMTVDGIDLILVQGKPEGTDPIFNPAEKLNFYYQTEHMKYLGRDRK